MKRQGYTIAETVITIAIIGIVAALTIPTFISSYRKHSYASSLSNAVATFENAMTTAIMRDGVTELFGTNAWRADDSDNFIRNLRIAYDTFNYDNTNRIYTIRLKNGTTYSLQIQNSDDNAKTELEVINAGTNLMARAGDLTIDVNGDSAPNIIGRDIFEYIVGNDGHLYPLHSNDWAVYTGSEYHSPRSRCVTNHDLDYCGAYLQLNDYQMDY